MRANHLTLPRLGLFLAAFAISANAVGAEPLVTLGKSLSDVAPCWVDEASKTANPPQSPDAVGTSGVKVTGVVDVALALKVADATAVPPPSAGSEPTELAGLQATASQVQRSTRNRSLDRIAQQTALKWRYVCPPSLPEAQRWARVEIAMDAPGAGPDPGQQALPRFAVAHFPLWAKARLMQSGPHTVQRDDRVMPRGSVAEIAARLQADDAFKKDEASQSFTMYATWDEPMQTARIWWLFDEHHGRATAAVLILDDYRNEARTYAVRCESSAAVCATFDQWLQPVTETWLR
ncbi:hypothetical protein [Xanthomonas sacchari]|uniref:hypothetical protein n=1 Tax=Xanthomonas sacchari TaxID=56458 RepID=UPI00225DD91D|nr:hypothetical protein [Xanthomonas sacchari]MCW0423583.1 hypothetical protein [Xanthomonas sacchari]